MSYFTSLRTELRQSLQTTFRGGAPIVFSLVTLALAIGVTSATFSVFHGVLLSPLPFEEPDRVAYLWHSNLEQGVEENYVSAPNFEDWRNQASSFASMAAIETDNATLSGADTAERVPLARVTPQFFALLGVEPILGRSFSADDSDLATTTDVAVLSHSLWQRKFGSRRDVTGDTLLVNERPHTIIGVMPRNFSFPDTELWTPLSLYAEDWQRKRGILFLQVVARLAPNATLKTAQNEMDLISTRLEELHPEANEGAGVKVELVFEDLVGGVRTRIVLLFAAAVLVLLIACANVANLLLVRSFNRRSELATRHTLGASRGRVVRQLFMESGYIAAGGSLLGLGVGWAMQNLLIAFSPPDLPRLENIEFGGEVLLFTLAATVVTTLLFGTAPAWKGLPKNLSEHLKEGEARSGLGGRRVWMGSMAVTVQIMLVTALLTCSGLLGRSLVTLMSNDVGFQGENVVTLQLSLPEIEYAEDPSRVAFHRQLAEELEATPGVEAAGAINSLPFSGWRRSTGFFIEGWDLDHQIADYRAVVGDYFDAMGIELLEGETFDPLREDVAIVDENLAQRYWSGASPLGQRISVSKQDGPWLTIIGVVQGIRHGGFASAQPATIYVPYSELSLRSMALVVKTRVSPDSMVSSLRNRIWNLDRDIPIYEIATMETLFARSLAQERFTLLLFLLFTVLALTLAMIGVYGVMAYNVTRRTHEMGVRLALGAQKIRVLSIVMNRSVMLGVLGVGLGLGLGVWLAGFMSSMLYGVSRVDPLVYTAVPALLLAATLLASLMSALRVTRINPAVALRDI